MAKVCQKPSVFRADHGIQEPTRNVGEGPSENPEGHADVMDERVRLAVMGRPASLSGRGGNGRLRGRADRRTGRFAIRPGRRLCRRDFVSARGCVGGGGAPPPPRGTGAIASTEDFHGRAPKVGAIVDRNLDGENNDRTRS